MAKHTPISKYRKQREARMNIYIIDWSWKDKKFEWFSTATVCKSLDGAKDQVLKRGAKLISEWNEIPEVNRWTANSEHVIWRITETELRS